MRTLGCGILCGGLAAACSGAGSSGFDEEAGATVEATCEWLEGDNCFRQALASAVPCMPPAGTKGVMSEDGSSCQYDTGHMVEFLELPGDVESLDYDFEHVRLYDAASLCLEFESAAAGYVVTSPAGVTALTVTPTSRDITCPDGRTRSLADEEYSKCDWDYQLGWGWWYSSADQLREFHLDAASPEPMLLYSCAGP